MNNTSTSKKVRRPRSKWQIQILSHLRRYHEIPIKYQYLGIGAKRYDDLCKDPNYTSNSELGLLLGNSDLLLKPIIKKTLSPKLKNINVIDIGCGNGEAGAIILSKLINNSCNVHLRYIALDISNKMRSIAQNTIDSRFNLNQEHKKIEIFSKSIDFEHNEIFDQIWKFVRSKNSLNIFLFLGNTLGNYKKIDDQINILKNISGSMRKTDYFIIGVELAIKRLPTVLVEMYSNPLVIEFLSTALELVHIIPDIGSTKGYGSIEARTVNNKDVDIRFKFSQLCIIPGSFKGEDIRFRIGDKIRLANSIRFHLPELKQIILSAAHLKVFGKEITNSSGSALLLCCLK